MATTCLGPMFRFQGIQRHKLNLFVMDAQICRYVEVKNYYYKHYFIKIYAI